MDIWDRHDGNFVWDKKDKIIFSIDHEKLFHLSFDNQLLQNISKIIKITCNNNWYTSDELKNCFVTEFTKMWKLMESEHDIIENVLKKYGESFETNDIERIKVGFGLPLELLMK